MAGLGRARGRERGSRDAARRCCPASGAQRSAPPVRLAAELGISCLLFGLYVVSSHQEEFSFLPPRANFPPTHPSKTSELWKPPRRASPALRCTNKAKPPPQASGCSPRRAQQTLKGHLAHSQLINKRFLSASPPPSRAGESWACSAATSRPSQQDKHIVEVGGVFGWSSFISLTSPLKNAVDGWSFACRRKPATPSPSLAALGMQ